MSRHAGPVLAPMSKEMSMQLSALTSSMFLVLNRCQNQSLLLSVKCRAHSVKTVEPECQSKRQPFTFSEPNVD